MPSNEHEELVDDVRSAWNEWRMKPENEANMNIWMAIDSYVASSVQPGLPTDIRADAYIDIDDGYPCIVVEIGRMPDGKWKHVVYDVDQKPIRVLRVGFDGVPYFIHSRGTEKEKEFYEFVKYWLVENADQN